MNQNNLFDFPEKHTNTDAENQMKYAHHYQRSNSLQKCCYFCCYSECKTLYTFNRKLKNIWYSCTMFESAISALCICDCFQFCQSKYEQDKAQQQC